MSSRKSRPIDLPHHATESQLHVSVAQYLDWTVLPPVMYSTFPAGWGKLNKGTAGRLYASGMKKGMPDILMFAPGKVVGIELKAGSNDVSAAQRETFAKLYAVGVRVYVCRSIEDVAAMLKRERIKCRLETKENGRERNLPTGPSDPAR